MLGIIGYVNRCQERLSVTQLHHVLILHTSLPSTHPYPPHIPPSTHPYPPHIPTLHTSLPSTHPYPPHIPTLHTSLPSTHPYPPHISTLHTSLPSTHPYPPHIPTLHTSLPSTHPYLHSSFSSLIGGCMQHTWGTDFRLSYTHLLL